MLLAKAAQFHVLLIPIEWNGCCSLPSHCLYRVFYWPKDIYCIKCSAANCNTMNSLLALSWFSIRKRLASFCWRYAFVLFFKHFFHSPSQSQPQPNRSRSTQSDRGATCSVQRHQGHLDLGGLVCSASCSTGPLGKPDVTACSRCSTCGHRGLLDDHPAASVALYWAEAQRPAPCVTPGHLQGWSSRSWHSETPPVTLAVLQHCCLSF